MTSNRDRQQRAAARARLEREMSERAQAARRRRRTRTVVAAGVGTLVVVAGVVWVVVATSGGDDKGAKASPSGSASASGAASQQCAWKPLVDPSAAPAQPLPAEVKDVGTPPATGEPRTGTQTMTIAMNVGEVKVQMDTAKAPCTAASYTYLASKKFFDGSKCHRLTTGGLFVLQCGDPSGTGKGGPAYQYGEENLPTDRRPAYPEGTFALANAGAGTNGSQFFIVYKDSELPANYTVLGKVTSGLDLVKKVAEGGINATDPSQAGDGAPKTEVKINSLTVAPPNPS